MIDWVGKHASYDIYHPCLALSCATPRPHFNLHTRRLAALVAVAVVAVVVVLCLALFK